MNKPNKLTFCETIINFEMKDFELLKQNFNLDDVTFCVIDKIVESEIKEKGYKVENLAQYFGISTPKLYKITRDAINTTTQILNDMNNIKYKHINIIAGLKMIILDHVINSK